MNRPRSERSVMTDTQWLGCKCSSEKIGDSCSGLRSVGTSLGLMSLLCFAGVDRILLVIDCSMYDLGLKEAGH